MAKESYLTKAKTLYEKNNKLDWHEWLDVKELFQEQGKQGVTGIMSSKTDSDVKYVFKVSKYIDYITNHEEQVMSDLNDVASFCPNFLHSFGLLQCYIDPNAEKHENPLICKSKYKIEKDVLLMEYINNANHFYDYIYDKNIPEHVLYAIVKQVLSGVLIAQNTKHFTHYDLHANNILVKRCDDNLVMFYIIDNETQFCVPTRGYCPVIIDYGFSYTKNCKNNYLQCGLEHTELGYTSIRFDQIADGKRFLISTSNDINKARKSVNSQKLRNITKNNYGKLSVDWKNGWDETGENSAVSQISDRLSGLYGSSRLFYKYEIDCLNILQGLITLPLTEQKQSDLDLSFTTFLNEFKKIENNIASSALCLYILKGIVDAANEVESDYTHGEYESAVRYFRFSILERIGTITKFCNPKSIDYEKMLCSLFCFRNAMEGMLYDILNSEKEYKVYLQNLEEVITAVDINIEDDYKFTEKTKIMVVDGINKLCYPIQVTPEELDMINKSDDKGNTLYKIISTE